MSIRIYFIIIVLGILTTSLSGQDKTGFTPDFRLSQTSAVSSGKDLPFWMTSNQNGVYALHNSSYLLFQAGINRSLDRDMLKKWGYTYSANMVYGIAGTSDFMRILINFWPHNLSR
jgi:hypothetical protein